MKGTLSTSQEWRGYQVYTITGNLTIPSGVTLTIEPGAIVKIADNCSITVNSGGTLNALGTRAQPITITSIHDDSVGGDTNENGTETIPQAGDYRTKNHGTLNLSSTEIFYGGYHSGSVPRHGSVGMIQANFGSAVLKNCI